MTEWRGITCEWSKIICNRTLHERWDRTDFTTLTLLLAAEVQGNLTSSGESATRISFIIIWDFWMFYQIFFSPQVKGCAIITYKHGIYYLPHELPSYLRLRILRKGNIRKVSKLHRKIAYCTASLPKWKFC